MKKTMLVAAVGLTLVFAVSGTQDGKAVSVPQEFESFLKDYEAKVIPLTRERNLAYFNATISGRDADYKKYNDLQVELKKYHSDPAAFAQVKALRDGGLIIDPVLKRELDLLYLSYLGNQIDSQLLEQITTLETAIEQKFNTYRAKVGDKTLTDNEVENTLRSSTNSQELETVWKASKEIGKVVEADLKELAKLRNRAATSIGFANFYEMQLKLSEIEPADLETLFNGLDSLTRGTFVQLKDEVDSALAVRLKISKDQLRPWHYQNRFFQEAPSVYDVDLSSFYAGKDPVEIAKKYYSGIGLKVDSILAHSDLYEKPGKYQHAYSTDIDRKGDSRIVCSLRPDYYWMGTLLHELGHATYSYYNDQKLPWLLRDAAHALTTEAVAVFFGSLPANPKWLVEVVGAPPDEVNKVAGACAQSLRAEMLIFSRWSQVMVHFERGLYGNPDQDLNKLWWDLVEKYQLLTRPEGRKEPDWASKIHIATSPVYYHSYLMGYLLAAQFTDAVGRNVLGSADPYHVSFAGDPRIGQYFVEKVYHPGTVFPWNEMIERATGQKLTAASYARQFVGAK